MSLEALTTRQGGAVQGKSQRDELEPFSHGTEIVDGVIVTPVTAEIKRYLDDEFGPTNDGEGNMNPHSQPGGFTSPTEPLFPGEDI